MINELISIVDDDVAIGDSIAELLLTVGINSHVFTSAEAFLASDLIDATVCLIADIKMPGIGGLELQKIALAKGFRFPVIFVSAFEDVAVKLSAKRAGAVGFLNKPFSEEDFFSCIRIALPDSFGSA